MSTEWHFSLNHQKTDYKILLDILLSHLTANSLILLITEFESSKPQMVNIYFVLFKVKYELTHVLPLDKYVWY